MSSALFLFFFSLLYFDGKFPICFLGLGTRRCQAGFFLSLTLLTSPSRHKLQSLDCNKEQTPTLALAPLPQPRVVRDLGVLLIKETPTPTSPPPRECRDFSPTRLFTAEQFHLFLSVVVASPLASLVYDVCQACMASCKNNNKKTSL